MSITTEDQQEIKTERYLTKSDFIQYLHCMKSLWLKKKRPEVYQKNATITSSQKSITDGFTTERYAQKLFKDGIFIPSYSNDLALQKTKEAIEKGDAGQVLFQPTFCTKRDLLIRADILERNDDGTYNLYEVKSSTKVKVFPEEKPLFPKEISCSIDHRHSHLKDVCFQVIVLEECGIPIREAYVIHLNSSYVLQGELDLKKLFKIVPITHEVDLIREQTEKEIASVLVLLQEKQIDEKDCSCYYKTKTNHCDTFSYFNTAVPEQSVYLLSGIREQKLRGLLKQNIVALADLPLDDTVTERHCVQVQAVKTNQRVVHEKKILEMIQPLTFPLYFFDYETITSPIPQIEGTKPHQQVPVQFSLHVLEEDQTLSHYEYLATHYRQPDELVETFHTMICDHGDYQNGVLKGTFISWHASFEKCRNAEMAEQFPQYKEFLLAVNEQTFDLKNCFIKDFVDAQFYGSASIKKVLPVVCPNVSYSNLSVQDGIEAQETWLQLVDEALSQEEKLEIQKALKAYCKMDTLAMVELYTVLRKVCDKVL